MTMKGFLNDLFAIILLKTIFVLNRNRLHECRNPHVEFRQSHLLSRRAITALQRGKKHVYAFHFPPECSSTGLQEWTVQLQEAWCSSWPPAVKPRLWLYSKNSGTVKTLANIWREQRDEEMEVVEVKKSHLSEELNRVGGFHYNCSPTSPSSGYPQDYPTILSCSSVAEHSWYFPLVNFKEESVSCG